MPTKPSESAIPRLGLAEKLGFGTFSTASNVVYQFKSLYYLFFLTNVLKIDVLIAGTILTIGTIWDAINDPLVGFWSVNHKFPSGERVRPFALWFSVPWAASVVLLFTDFHADNTVTIILSLAIYIVFELLNTFVAIPYNGMGSLATNYDPDRRAINVFRNLGGCLGSGIGAVACLPLLKLFGALDAKGNLIDATSGRGFVLAAVVMGCVCIVGCLVHYFTTKERVRPLSGEESHISAKEAARMLLKSKSFVLNTLYVICYGVINLLMMTCVIYYATYVIGSTSSATVVQAAYLAASVLTSFFVSPIDKRLGRRKTMLLSAVIFILGKVWFVLDPFAIGALYVNAITVGVAVTITFVMFNTNRNNIVDIVEWKGGRRLDSLVSTADNLAAKLASAGTTQLIAVALSASGFSAKLAVQPESAIQTINAMLGWVPMLVAVLMFVVCWFHPVEKEFAELQAARRAEA